MLFIVTVALFLFFNLLACESGNMDLSTVPPGNIGGAFVVAPASGTATINSIGLEVPLFQLPPQPGEEPENLCLSFAASTTVPGVASGPGPIVGILNYGAGSGNNQRVEFDIPVMVPNFTAGVGTGSVAGSGVLISVPAGTVYAAARNDANLIPPAPGATETLGNPTDPPVIVTAHVGSGNSESSRIFRTVWASRQTAGGGLANGFSISLAVPPLAKTVRFVRFNSANAIAIVMLGAKNIASMDGPYVIAAGAVSPIFDLSGSVAAVSITNNGPGTMLQLAAVFEIGF